MTDDDTRTDVSADRESLQPGTGWTLAIAFSAGEPRRLPRRLSLGDATRVELGRSTPFGWERGDGRTVTVHLDDRMASQQHARLTRRGDGWIVEDLDSKNGTRLNGARLAASASVGDGDVIECGGTFAVLRDAGGGDLELPVGPHPALQTVSARFERELDMMARIARARVAVLLRGETGTGKEIAARAIHDLSGRGGPFVAVNCGALAPQLVTSELFGTRRGAYSGATEDRVGLVRSAHGGTLFLDEIAELSGEAQTALLRVLQESEVVPVGGTHPIKVDLRIVAATHERLDALAEAGRFRK
ncbi:MAG: sigma 54-interacting transcriptional regulator, partial [Kofleriaceae bacterium]